MRLTEIFHSDDHYYFVCEYLHGCNLSCHMNKLDNAEDTEKCVVYIITQLLHACKYLHGKQIVHRDLNPNSIYLSELDCSSQLYKPEEWKIKISNLNHA